MHARALRSPTIRSYSAIAAGVISGFVLAGAAHGAVTPTFVNNNDTVDGGIWKSSLSGRHTDIPGGSTFTSAMPSAGTIANTAALQAPFNGSGQLMTVGGVSTKAKGGAGYTTGSNLAKITFAAGTGVDQTDGSGNHANGSTYTLDFNYKFRFNSAGTFGGAIAGFSAPVGGNVGAGGSCKFEYQVFWDKVVDGVTTLNVRPADAGSVTFPNPSFPSAGAFLTTISATNATVPSFAVSGGNDYLVVHGSIKFTADNADSPSIIEFMGQNEPGGTFPKEMSQELKSDPDFAALWIADGNSANPQFHKEAGAGFEDDPANTPEPSSVFVIAAGASCALLRRRHRS